MLAEHFLYFDFSGRELFFRFGFAEHDFRCIFPVDLVQVFFKVAHTCFAGIAVRNE
jgi:hypothetical protein